MTSAQIPAACQLCDHKCNTFEVVGHYVYGGSELQKFYRCPSCDVAFLFPPPNKDEEALFYAQEFEKFMEGRSGGDRDWSGPEAHIVANQDQVARRMPLLEKALNRPQLRLLELGCSSGFMLLPLRDRNVEVMGVEPSGMFTGFVRSQGIPVFESLEQFQQQAEANGPLDIVTHFFLLEHLSDPVGFLAQCLRLLRPGGKVFFEVPSRDDPLVTVYDVPAFHEFYWSVAHRWYFNRASLEFVLEQLPCSYEIIPEQRYDLSNHMWWALMGKPGGMKKFSGHFTQELDDAYKESMRRTGHCDAFFVWLHKPA